MQRDSSSESDQVSEQEVVRYLTNDGKQPIEYAFLISEWGSLAFWRPEDGNIVDCKMRDNELFGACRRYLMSRGQWYRTDEEVYTTAKLKNWTGWQLAERRKSMPQEDI